MYYLIRNEHFSDTLRGFLEDEGMESCLPFQDDDLGACQLIELDDIDDVSTLSLSRAAGFIYLGYAPSRQEGVMVLQFGESIGDPQEVRPPFDEGPFRRTWATVGDGIDLTTTLSHGQLLDVSDLADLTGLDAYAEEVFEWLRVEGWERMPITPAVLRVVYNNHAAGYGSGEVGSHIASSFSLETGTRPRRTYPYPSEVQIVPTAIREDLNEELLPPVPAVLDPMIAITSWSSERSNDMIPRMIGVLERHKRSFTSGVLEVNVVHGAVADTRPPANSPGNDPFHITIWSAPRGGANIRYPMTPAEVLGVPVLMQNMAFLVDSPDGDAWDNLGFVGELRDPVTDFTYAYLFDNHLHITFDAVHVYHQDTFRLMDAILERAAAMMSPAERERRRRELIGRRQQQARTAYINWVGQRDTQRLSQLQRELELTQSSIEHTTRTLTDLLRERPRLTAQVEALRAAGPRDTEGYGAEFDKLLEHPKIVDVRFSEDVLEVHTTDLFVQHEDRGTWYHLGEFSITLDEGGTLSFFNKTRQVDGYENGMQAPHVFHRGNACYGTLEEVIPSLASQREYASIFVMGIAFLESVNLRDAAGKYLTNWPEVPEAVALGERPITYIGQGEEEEVEA